MELGISISPEGELKENIREAPDPVDFVEMPIGELERSIDGLDAEEINETVREQGYDVVAHLPFSHPVVTEVEEFNKAEIGYLETVLDFASDINAKKAVLHPNTRYRQEENEIRDRFREQLKTLNRIAEQKDIELCVENMPDQVPSAANNFVLADILEELDIAMCFDTGHGYASMGQQEMESFLEEYARLISHLHLQDTREGEDLHMPVGSAEIDFEAIGEKLDDFDGTATMEVFTYDNDYILLSRQKVLEYF